jgi:hypothetical protein
LKCIEATSDKLLGTYSKAEDDALSAAFGGRGKKRLNRVFDAIGFIYHDYCYPLKKGKKRKIIASATTAVPKGKKIKVLTHRPRYIETVVVPEFSEGTSSTTEAKQAAPAAWSAKGSIVVPKVPTAGPAEAKDDAAKKPKLEKTVMMPKILSAPAGADLPKVTKAPATTPKRRRMASVLDAVIVTTKILTPAPTKKDAEAVTVQAEAEPGPSVPIETKPAAPEDKAEQQTLDAGMAAGQDMVEKAKSPAPEAHKTEVEDLRKQLAEANENCAIAKASQEISEWWKTKLEKNIEELRESKERCFEKSLDCVKKLKTSFSKVEAYSSEENFVRGDPGGVIEWISREAEAFEEILSDHGDICAFSGARGITAILEKAGCDHVKATTQAEAAFSIDDIKDPSAEATLVGGKFYSDVWVHGGRELANEIIKKNEKDTHDAPKKS